MNPISNPRLFPAGLLTALALIIGAATCVISTLHAADDILRQPEARFTDFPWEAEWISHPTAPPKAYGVYHFRKAFSLEQQPKSFVIHLSADNEYRLFVNNQRVIEGPERGDALNWRFETLDIASYLKAGKNVLAIQVWNFAEHAPVAQITKQTALVVQGNSALEAVVNTNRQWKVTRNEAYQPIPDFDRKLGTYIVIGPGDDIDGASYPWGWQESDFDDGKWEQALSLRVAKPKGCDTDGKWLLVPRSIPLMREDQIRFMRVRQSEGVKVPAGFLKGNEPFQIPAHTKATMLLDHDMMTTAYPELKVSGGAGSMIRLVYAESPYVGKKEDRSLFKGHREDITGKHIRGVEEVFRPDGGAGRVFTTLRWRAFRYVQLEIETADQALSMDDISARFSVYPFDEKASFASSEDSFQKIWEICWRTLALGSHDLFTDSPYYEQLMYVGDTRIEALTSLYVSGDDRLMRKAIRSFDGCRFPNGLTTSRYPDANQQIIPPYSLVWISMLHDYLIYRNDPDFVKSFLPGMREVLRYFREEADPATGSYIGRKWWNFVDWVPEWGEDPRILLGGVPPRDAQGVSSIIDLQHVYTLQQAAEIFNHFGLVDEAAKTTEFAGKIRTKTLSRCWDENRGLLADTPEKLTFSQHANSYLILTEKADKVDINQLGRKMMTEPGLAKATYYFDFYTHAALRKAGFGDDYSAWMEPWRDMLKIGLTCTPENPPDAKGDARSDCHAWGAHPLMGFLQTVCGIDSAGPGFQKVLVEPHLGKLTHAHGKMPHAMGMIEAKYDRVGPAGTKAEITLPAGLEGVFRWKGKETTLHAGLNSIDLKD